MSVTLPSHARTRASAPRARSVATACGLLLAATAGLAGGCKPRGDASTQRAWNAANDPVILRGNRKLERRLAALPNQGRVQRESRPWADTFWPSRVGGIAARWNSPNPFGFTTTPPNFEELGRMSLEARAQLSPAEKYDAFMGNYSYPLTQWEKRRTSPAAAEWSGLCHGVAAASTLFEEPGAVVVKSAHGVDIPFGAADLKGLLALYVGYIATNDLKFVGERCNRPLPPSAGGIDAPVDVGTGFGRESLTECEDVNAGSFHLLLANLVGEAGESIIADISRGGEVWNFPIVEYKATEKGERRPQTTAAPGTVKERLVETEVHYVARGVPSWKPENAMLPSTIEKVTYQYALELNGDGEVIGGEWLVPEYPDFLWRQAKPEFQFYFHKLGDLLKASRETPDGGADLTFR